MLLCCWISNCRVNKNKNKKEEFIVEWTIPMDSCICKVFVPFFHFCNVLDITQVFTDKTESFLRLRALIKSRPDERHLKIFFITDSYIRHPPNYIPFNFFMVSSPPTLHSITPKAKILFSDKTRWNFTS